jgi:uncharacterized protein (TIGR02145 family)
VSVAGKGGYTKGTINLGANDVLYVYVGCQGVAGQNNYSLNYVFNGGAYVHTSSDGVKDSGGGGGATDFRLIDGDWDSLTSLQSRILVAGGGGGGYTSRTNQAGGLDLPNDGSGNGGQNGSYGCTTGLGSFGKGGATDSSDDYGGGGGGWYGGCSYSDAAGAGGSSYVFTDNSDPAGYSPNNTPDSRFHLTDTQITAGNATMPNPESTATMIGKSGSGYARISLLSITSEPPYLNLTLDSDTLVFKDANNNSTILPTESGTLATVSNTITIATNNSAGYTLSIETTTNHSNLTHQSLSNTIPPATGTFSSAPDTTQSILDRNTWGFTLTANPEKGSAIWSKVPLKDHPVTIQETTSASPTESPSQITIYYGANISTTPAIPPYGYYSTSVLYTAITKEPPVPPLTLPDGINQDNISPTNPAVLDVYPTTGWEGDVVAITSNALFTDVKSVTIGGTACQSYNVVTSSLIACKLPAQAAGSTNIIVVANGNDSNLIVPEFQQHMRVTYFNPASDSVTIGGITYDFYANGFTAANCSTLTASNSTSDNLPNSVVYVRDTRNKQTYRVKRMIDNKCWMIDNLKYVDSNITFNNGDHNGDGTSGDHNTVDGTMSESDINLNKAFYNNPVDDYYCWNMMGEYEMPSGTTTKCGYLYNWYAATAGTGTYSASMGAGLQATGSICPTGFRLPSGTSGPSGPTTDGIVYTAADFAVLNASMNAGGLAAGDATGYYAGWIYSGQWQGVYSGEYYSGNGLDDQGNAGYYWSSTALSNSGGGARMLRFTNYPSVSPGNLPTDLYHGHSVRCLVEAPPPAAPPPDTPVVTIQSTGDYGEDITFTTSADGICSLYKYNNSYDFSTPDNQSPATTVLAGESKTISLSEAGYYGPGYDGIYTVACWADGYLEVMDEVGVPPKITWTELSFYSMHPSYTVNIGVQTNFSAYCKYEILEWQSWPGPTYPEMYNTFNQLNATNFYSNATTPSSMMDMHYYFYAACASIFGDESSYSATEYLGDVNVPADSPGGGEVCWEDGQYFPGSYCCINNPEGNPALCSDGVYPMQIQGVSVRKYLGTVPTRPHSLRKTNTLEGVIPKLTVFAKFGNTPLESIAFYNSPQSRPTLISTFNRTPISG